MIERGHRGDFNLVSDSSRLLTRRKRSGIHQDQYQTNFSGIQNKCHAHATSVCTKASLVSIGQENLKCMTGKELFDHYQAIALRNGFGSAEFTYGNVLFEAMKLDGEATIFKKLEVANAEGRRIQLAYSNPPDDPETEPDLVIVV